MKLVEDLMMVDELQTINSSTEEMDAKVSSTPYSTPSANTLRLFQPKDKQPQQMAFWDMLPSELRFYIIAQFDPKTLRSGAQVCTEWKFFCDEDKLWEAHCKSIGLTSKPSNRTWKWLFKVKTVAFIKSCGMSFGFLETEEPKGLYYGEWKNDNFHGLGYFEWFQHGLKYFGEYVDGLRHGYGMLVWKNNDRYEGHFENDMKHGSGVFNWSNGDIYSGDYAKDKKQGVGKITWGSHPGESYEGEWSADKKQGVGKYFWSNGGSYEGSWFDNKRNGQGIEKWPSGSKYEGNWVENEMHGWGYKICTRDGKPDGFYEGPFQDGRAHGRGFRKYEDGATYEGDYAADKRVGFGTYTWADGDKFSGTWQVGREKGFFITRNGESYYQEWFEDKLKEDCRKGAELYQVNSIRQKYIE